MPLCMKDSRISRCWRILLTLFRFGGYGRIITVPIAPPSTDFRKALVTSAADPLGIGSRERIPLVKVKDTRSEIWLMLVRTRFIWDSALFGRASLKSAKVSSKGAKGVGMNGHGHVV